MFSSSARSLTSKLSKASGSGTDPNDPPNSERGREPAGAAHHDHGADSFGSLAAEMGSGRPSIVGSPASSSGGGNSGGNSGGSSRLKSFGKAGASLRAKAAGALSSAAAKGNMIAGNAPSSHPLFFNPTPTDHEGWLITRKERNALGWKRRYVRLWGSTLVVYRDDAEDNVKASHNIVGWRITVARPRKGGLSSRKEIYRFTMSDATTGWSEDWAAEDSEEQRTAWLDALVSAADVGGGGGGGGGSDAGGWDQGGVGGWGDGAGGTGADVGAGAGASTGAGANAGAGAGSGTGPAPRGLVSCTCWSDHPTFGFSACASCNFPKRDHFFPPLSANLDHTTDNVMVRKQKKATGLGSWKRRSLTLKLVARTSAYPPLHLYKI